MCLMDSHVLVFSVSPAVASRCDTRRKITSERMERDGIFRCMFRSACYKRSTERRRIEHKRHVDYLKQEYSAEPVVSIGVLSIAF